MSDAPARPHALARPWLWLVAFAWWTAEGLASASQALFMAAAEGRSVAWDHALRTSMASAWLWIPLSLAIAWMSEAWPLSRRGGTRCVLAHVAGALLVLVARAAAVVALNGWVGWYSALPPLRVVLVQSFLNNFLLYWMLVGVAHAWLFARREGARAAEAARLSGALAAAELAALKSQLQPHFLFNALGSISELVHLDPEAADRMLVKLSALLRHTLDDASAQEVTLQDELSSLELYLAIEEVRFGDRLTVRWDIDPKARAALVPHLVLQPLVENAVQHGVGPRAGAGAVTVAARAAGERLVLAVRDDGVGRAAEVLAGAGVGLTNTRTRLQLLYGAHHRVTVRDAAGGGVEVELELPRRTRRPGGEE